MPNGRVSYAQPATPNHDDFALEDIMPGYRWLELYPDGEIKTGVERVPRKEYGIDFDSRGY